MHEERLEDALGVVEGPVGQSQLLHLGFLRDAAGRASPHATGALDCPGVDDCREKVDQGVDEGRAEVLPEEDGRVADLRAQVLERELGAVADAKLGELFRSSRQGGGLALAGLEREGEALPGRVELGLGLGEGGLEVVDGGLLRGGGEREQRERESFC